MSERTEPDAAAQVRWLVLGRFSSEPSGARFRVRADGFVEALAVRAGTLSLRAPASLGGTGGAPITIVPRSLRDLSLRGVIDASAALGELRALAEAFGTEGDGALPRARELLSGGTLLEALEGALAPGGGPAAPTTSPSVDEVLAATAKGPTSAAAPAIDAFVRGLRGGEKRRPGREHRKARDLLEQATYAAAREALAAPEVASIEASWRGLRFLLDQCPAASMISVEVIDVGHEGAVAALEGYEPAEAMDAPDAVFVAHRMGSLDALRELARVGEERLCPVVVGVDPALFGARDEAELADALDDDDARAAGEDWASIRADEASRFLCVVANDLLLHAEGTGAAERVVLGSGVWAVAAQLSASYRRSGTFAQVVGASFPLVAPAARVLRGGRHDGTSCATAALYPARAQAALAKHGLLAVGAVRNSDRVVFSSSPMAHCGGDAAPLAAQLVTGRVVRFARWVREQLPEDTTADDVRTIFESGARVLLFPGLGELARVGADLRELEGERVLAVEARVSAAYAGTAIEFAFGLPL